jgi:hypothetical protein
MTTKLVTDLNVSSKRIARRPIIFLGLTAMGLMGPGNGWR